MAQAGPGRVELVEPRPLPFSAPLDFACQGCGAYCCTNERLVLSPLEVRRLARTLGIDTSDLSAQGWLAAFPDAESGLPRVAVEFLPVRPGLTACPFLAPGGPDGPAALTGSAAERLEQVQERQAGTLTLLAAAGEDGGKHLPLRCGVYVGRPMTCRSFPLRVKLKLARDGTPVGWSTLAHVRCPGHGQGTVGRSAGDYLAAGGVAQLAESRLPWHRLKLDIATAGGRLDDHERAAGSRRALWDATLNLLYASGARPRLQVPDDAYVPAIGDLFRRYLAPAAPLMDAELRAAAGTLTRADAADQLRALVAACQALEAALDQPPPSAATSPTTSAVPGASG